MAFEILGSFGGVGPLGQVLADAAPMLGCFAAYPWALLIGLLLVVVAVIELATLERR